MEDKFEKLGQLIDELDVLTYSLAMDLPASMHVDQLRKLLPDKVKALKEVFVDISGENPWD
jgi:hypothetical protein